MSIRVIASVGVMLSLAVTSFSIYLGIIEHSYSPAQTREYSLTSLEGRKTICLQYQAATSTTSTVIPGSTKVVQCGDQSS
jgi:hypothetical protein